MNPAKHGIVDARTSRYAETYARWQRDPEGIGLTWRHSRAPARVLKMSITLAAREARPAGGLILLTRRTVPKT